VNRVFADSSYFLALLNKRDELHSRAVEITPLFQGQLLTTTWVLTEVLDALSKPTHRKLASEFARDMQSDPDVVILPAAQALFDAGLELYSQRSDKDWSLTDCISFAVMKQNNLHEALTADHHFEQAGFERLL
jgi:predicted nucleic acid-binding protein